MAKGVLELIVEIKKNNKNSLEELILKFSPLIKKYKRKLNYEDAENDLIEHFIIIIRGMPTMNTEAKAIKYINFCMKNKFIKLSKKNKNYSDKIILIDFTEDIYCNQTGHKQLSIDMKNCLNQLSDNRKKILILRYIYGYSDEEISNMMKISRQAVCKSRKKALEQLKSYKGVG